MPRVKIEPRLKPEAPGEPRIEVQPEIGGPLYTAEGGVEMEINNPRELARILQIPGCHLVDGSAKPPAPVIPRRGPGRPRKSV